MGHNSVDMSLNSEEVLLFDWELLQQEIDEYLGINVTNCDRNSALCFQDKEDQRFGEKYVIKIIATY